MQMGDYTRFELERAQRGGRHEEDEYQREGGGMIPSDNGDGGGDTDMSFASRGAPPHRRRERSARSAHSKNGSFER
jgi:hypothetical protein